MTDTDLTVAVTGPTGTFGHGVMPLLEADDRIAKVVGIARSPFDPAAEGWTKMEYRRGDVRDASALEEAFQGVDVVMHLAFLIMGGSEERAQAINVEGTLNAFRAAATVAARRFVYASSVAAYGFHRDNPMGMREEWPTRAADRLLYAQEKAELEHLLEQEAALHPEVDVYVLRPSIVLGPHAVGGKLQLPAPLAGLGRALLLGLGSMPLPVPVVVPDLPVQFVHEEDVGQALLLCTVGAGPAGAYNIAADDVLTVGEVAREAGLLPVVTLPSRPTRTAARLLTRVPHLPAVAGWVEALSHPAVMDTTRARTSLGWTPRWTARRALRDTLGR